jgi:peptide deformylase
VSDREHDHEHEHDEHEQDEELEEAAERDAERELRKRLALAQIRQYGDTVLRMRANEVAEYDEELARIGERMIGLMHDAEGVGLAATQIGILRRLFVFHDDGEDRLLVNPTIASRSEETELDVEGCLSLGPVRVPVERATAVTVEARDEAGEQLRLELDGYAARVVQHELDHLDGVLILDRTDPESRREALSLLRPRIVLSR